MQVSVGLFLGRSCNPIGARLANSFQSIKNSFPLASRRPSFPWPRTRFFVQAGLFLWLLVCFSVAAMAQVNVYTRSYDTSRTGANLQETILTPANVNATNFGKLLDLPYRRGNFRPTPLCVEPGDCRGTHNVVFVASMLNTVYALDADTGAQLWSQNFGSPIIPEDVENEQNISYATGLGILGTPVIDPTTNIMYFVSGSQPASGAAAILRPSQRD